MFVNTVLGVDQDNMQSDDHISVLPLYNNLIGLIEVIGASMTTNNARIVGETELMYVRPLEKNRCKLGLGCRKETSIYQIPRC